MTITYYYRVNLDPNHKHVTLKPETYLSHFTSYDIDIPDFSPSEVFRLDVEGISYRTPPNYAKITVGIFPLYYFIYPISSCGAVVHMEFVLDKWMTGIQGMSTPLTVSGRIIRDSQPPYSTPCKNQIAMITNASVPSQWYNANWHNEMTHYKIVISFIYTAGSGRRIGVAVTSETFNGNVSNSSERENFYAGVLGVLSQLSTIDQYSVTVDGKTETYGINGITGAWLVPSFLVNIFDSDTYARFYRNTIPSFNFYLIANTGRFSRTGLELNVNNRSNALFIGNRNINIIVDPCEYCFTRIPRLSLDVSCLISIAENAVTFTMQFDGKTYDLTPSLELSYFCRSTDVTDSQLAIKDAVNLASGVLSVTTSVATKNPIGIASGLIGVAGTVGDMATRVVGNAMSVTGGGIASISSGSAYDQYTILGACEVYFIPVVNWKERESEIITNGYITNYIANEEDISTNTIRYRVIQIENPILHFSGLAVGRQFTDFIEEVLARGVTLWNDTPSSLLYGIYYV